eukprot:TRINITY_DN2181_c0_g1_i5.p1 TRINITY_DN2181_c0_g1~~TRINITY_DN2181_c0_g1_i5.p1  ORF type:complete len:805 (+),score=172.17 TRINITY_DN2181_c0_g1_i5:655-3069(+)
MVTNHLSRVADHFRKRMVAHAAALVAAKAKAAAAAAKAKAEAVAAAKAAAAAVKAAEEAKRKEAALLAEQKRKKEAAAAAAEAALASSALGKASTASPKPGVGKASPSKAVEKDGETPGSIASTSTPSTEVPGGASGATDMAVDLGQGLEGNAFLEEKAEGLEVAASEEVDLDLEEPEAEQEQENEQEQDIEEAKEGGADEDGEEEVVPSEIPTTRTLLVVAKKGAEPDGPSEASIRSLFESVLMDRLEVPEGLLESPEMVLSVTQLDRFLTMVELAHEQLAGACLELKRREATVFPDFVLSLGPGGDSEPPTRAGIGELTVTGVPEEMSVDGLYKLLHKALHTHATSNERTRARKASQWKLVETLTLDPIAKQARVYLATEQLADRVEAIYAADAKAFLGMVPKRTGITKGLPASESGGRIKIATGRGPGKAPERVSSGSRPGGAPSAKDVANARMKVDPQRSVFVQRLKPDATPESVEALITGVLKSKLSAQDLATAGPNRPPVVTVHMLKPFSAFVQLGSERLAKRTLELYVYGSEFFGGVEVKPHKGSKFDTAEYDKHYKRRPASTALLDVPGGPGDLRGPEGYQRNHRNEELPSHKKMRLSGNQTGLARPIPQGNSSGFSPLARGAPPRDAPRFSGAPGGGGGHGGGHSGAHAPLPAHVRDGAGAPRRGLASENHRPSSTFSPPQHRSTNPPLSSRGGPAGGPDDGYVRLDRERCLFIHNVPQPFSEARMRSLLNRVLAEETGQTQAGYITRMRPLKGTGAFVEMENSRLCEVLVKAFLRERDPSRRFAGMILRKANYK